MEDPNSILWISIIGAIVSTVGGLAAIFGNLYKLKPESKKIESESESAIADAADSIANGAKVSNELLLNRLLEMEKRERDRDVREAELLEQVKMSKKELSEIRASMADWQDWASRLVHQIRSYGKEPVPFKIDPKAEMSATD